MTVTKQGGVTRLMADSTAKLPRKKKMYHQGSKMKQNITLANTMIFIKNLIISDSDVYPIQDLNNIIYDSMFHLPI